jgi:hypothetical protein
VGTDYRLRVAAIISSPHLASLLQLMKSVYFAMRGAIEPACIYHLDILSSTATPLPNQEWRGVLFDDINSMVRNSKSPKARAAHDYWAPHCENLTPKSKQRPRRLCYQAQKLRELNFRFEFLGLGKRVFPSNDGEDARPDVIMGRFGANSLSIVDHRGEHGTGLRQLE